jgi:hypothetical protein
MARFLVNKHVREPLAKGARNFECQLQVGVKPTPFDGVARLARHPHLGGNRIWSRTRAKSLCRSCTRLNILLKGALKRVNARGGRAERRLSQLTIRYECRSIPYANLGPGRRLDCANFCAHPTDRWAHVGTASHMLESRLSCFVSAETLKIGRLFSVARLP